MRILPLLALLLGACTIEDRTPAGSRADEAAIRSTVAAYYRSVAEGDVRGARQALWDSVLVVSEQPGRWQGIRGADAWVDSLAAQRQALPPGAGGIEAMRLDVRQEGNVAAVWTTLRGAGTARSDHLVLTRDGDVWRIVSLTLAVGRREG